MITKIYEYTSKINGTPYKRYQVSVIGTNTGRWDIKCFSDFNKADICREMTNVALCAGKTPEEVKLAFKDGTLKVEASNV